MIINLFNDFKDKFCHHIAFSIAEAESYSNPFISKQIIYQRMHLQIKNSLDEFFKRLYRGIQILKEELLHFDKEKQAQFNAIFLALDPSQLTSRTISEYPAKLSQTQLEDLYALTNRLIGERKMLEASDLLIVLTLLAPECFEFWLAMGLVEQELGHYELALSALAQASLLNFEHPIPHVLSAECYQALGDMDNAQHSLTLALSFKKQDSAWDSINPRLKKLQVLLSHAI